MDLETENRHLWIYGLCKGIAYGEDWGPTDSSYDRCGFIIDGVR